jgi:hypothetical protein
MSIPSMTIGAVLASKSNRLGNFADYAGRVRRHECGYQDRLNGHAPETGDPDYFKGYCEAVCDEIAADARRDASVGRADWWGLAD